MADPCTRRRRDLLIYWWQFHLKIFLIASSSCRTWNRYFVGERIDRIWLHGRRSPRQKEIRRITIYAFEISNHGARDYSGRKKKKKKFLPVIRPRNWDPLQEFLWHLRMRVGNERILVDISSTSVLLFVELRTRKIYSFLSRLSSWMRNLSWNIFPVF